MIARILYDFWIGIRAIVTFIGVLLWILPSSIFKFPLTVAGPYLVLVGIVEVVEYCSSRRVSALFWGIGFLICGITIMVFDIIKKYKKQANN